MKTTKINNEVIIELNAAEQRLIRFISKERFTRYKDHLLGKNHQSLQQVVEGLGGEFAFCKLFNLYPDISIEIPEEDAGDCGTHGKRIDVKTTQYEQGNLLVVPWKNFNKIDFFALMVGTFPKYKYKGLMPTSQVKQDENLTDLGHGKVYLIKQNLLNF